MHNQFFVIKGWEKMKLNFINKETKIIFEVSDYENKYEDVLKASFYVSKGAKYIKEYNKKDIYSGNTDSIRTTFLKHGEEMFDQMAYKKISMGRRLKRIHKESKKYEYRLVADRKRCVRCERTSCKTS
jgi:hypothetical protein